MSHWAKILITLELRINFGPVLLRRASVAVTAQHYTILNCGHTGMHYAVVLLTENNQKLRKKLTN